MAVTNEDVRLRDVVRELKQGPPRILLVGSAISAPPPSSLPMVGQALSDILQSLVESCEARGVIFGRQRSPIIGLNTRVKFELFFAVLADYFGSSPTRSLVASVYGQRRPNRNHESPPKTHFAAGRARRRDRDSRRATYRAYGSEFRNFSMGTRNSQGDCGVT